MAVLDHACSSVIDGRTISPCQLLLLRWLLVPEDLTYAEVAVRMGKSEFAVKKYVHTLFKRFKINSKGGLIKLGLRRGLDRLGPPVAVG